MIGTYKYKVAPKEVDFSAKMTLVALADHILETAGDNAEAIGFGTSVLNAKNRTWVLSRFYIEVSRYLNIYEEFTVTTWIESADKICSLRSFTVEDMQGNCVARASTLWSILDLSTRRVCDFSMLGPYHTFVVTRDGISVARPSKLRAIQDCSNAESIHRVNYMDIDFNGHTNSTSYIGWILNSLDLEWFKANKITAITLNFVHESRYAEEVSLYTRTTSNQIECTISTPEHAICLAELKTAQK